MLMITGASGSIGSALLNHFGDDAISVSRTPIERHNHIMANLSNSYAVANVFQVYKPTTILHFAANANPKPSIDNIRNMTENNILSLRNILDFCPENCHIINASSIVVYGDQQKILNEGDVCQPTSFYGTTKLACEQLLQIYGVKHTNLRLTATLTKNLTHGVVKAFIDRLKNEEIFYAIGNSPGSIKPYLHIEDLISAISLIMNMELLGNFNVGPIDSASIQEVAEQCMSALNIHKDIEWRPDLMWAGDNPEIRICTQKLQACGWRQKFNSRETIFDIVKEMNE